MKKCDCPLAGHIEVPYTYPSRKNFNDIMLVGESPGRDEEKGGKPFIGRAGQMLRKHVADAGIEINDCVIANSARCLIDKRQLTSANQKKVLSACRSKLENCIHKAQPEIIVLLGDFALRQVLKTGGITRKRGKLIWSPEFNCWALPMLHPAYVLRNPAMETFLAEDMRYLKELQKAGFDPNAINRPKKDYQTVRSIRPLLKLASESSKPVFVAFDTETQGMDRYSDDTFVISYSVSWADNQGVQVRLHRLCKGKEQADFYVKIPGDSVNVYSIKAMSKIRRRLIEIKRLFRHPNIRLFMQNGNFDRHQLAKLFKDYGMTPPEALNYVMDIQAGAHVLDENVFTMASLDTMQRFFLKEWSDWKTEFYGKYSAERMIEVPKKDLMLYSVEDSDLTRQIGAIVAHKISKAPRLKNYFKNLVMPVLNVLYMMEENGIWIDQKAIPEVTSKIISMASKAQNRALKLVPDAVKAKHQEKGYSFRRRDFVADTIFSREGFGLETLAKRLINDDRRNTKILVTPSRDGFSTARPCRAMLQEKSIPPAARKFLNAFDEWSEWDGLNSKSIKQIREHLKSDGRVHTTYSLTTAVTGRTSSRRIQLQNIPHRTESSKYINRLFAAKPGGWTLIEADMSQAELRLISSISQDPAMMKVYLENGDIHLETAKALSKKPWDSLSEREQKEIRIYSKSANFSIVYGTSANGYRNYCRITFGLLMSLKQAQENINRFFAKYPRILDYHRDTIKELRQRGYVESPLGRRRRLPQIYSGDDFLVGEAQRMAINFKIQSASSDITLLALTEMLKDSNFDQRECKPLMFIHDALVFECRTKKIEYYGKLIKRHMENPPLDRFGVKLRVPLRADLQSGHSRAEMKMLEI